MQVVSRVESLDALSGGKLSMEYAYHHGYWDGEEREFRGFARVDQRDTETFERYHEEGLHPGGDFQTVPAARFSPPTETRHWFHVGPVSDGEGDWEEPDLLHGTWSEDSGVLERPSAVVALLAGLPRRDRRDALRTLRGRTLRTELYSRDGSEREDRPYTVTEALHGLREEEPLAAGEERRRIFFPHLLGERSSRWERGSEPMHRFAFTADYDGYGQPRAAVKVAGAAWPELRRADVARGADVGLRQPDGFRAGGYGGALQGGCGVSLDHLRGHRRRHPWRLRAARQRAVGHPAARGAVPDGELFRR